MPCFPIDKSPYVAARRSAGKLVIILENKPARASFERFQLPAFEPSFGGVVGLDTGNNIRRGCARCGMLETIRRTVAGVELIRCLCGCESCGHLWLANGEPQRCSRCHLRTWRGKDAPVSDPVVSRRALDPVKAEPKAKRKRLRLVEPQPPKKEAPEPSAPLPKGAKPCPICHHICINAFALKMHRCGWPSPA